MWGDVTKFIARFCREVERILLRSRFVFEGTRHTYAYAIFPPWKYPASLYKYSSARGSSRMRGSEKSNYWRGKAERKGGLKLSRRISSFLHEQPANHPFFFLSFFSLRISDLFTVLSRFLSRATLTAPSLHRKLANNSRKRREREKRGGTQGRTNDGWWNSNPLAGEVLRDSFD